MSALTISAAFPPGHDTPDLVALAEDLGYARAWLYDSPALYHDVWMTLARAAERTSRIGLGPAVLVPSLRHPMVNAAAIATLEDLAPGRVAVAIGAGVTRRHVLGQRPMRWADVREYIVVLRALLRGDDAEWEGATEMAGPGAVDRLPGGQVWREAVERVPPEHRHLAVHEGHVVMLTERDRAALHAGAATRIPDLTLTGTADEVRARIDAFAESGITELAYHAAGPDIPRELRAFADAAGL